MIGLDRETCRIELSNYDDLVVPVQPNQAMIVCFEYLAPVLVPVVTLHTLEESLVHTQLALHLKNLFCFEIVLVEV